MTEQNDHQAQPQEEAQAEAPQQPTATPANEGPTADERQYAMFCHLAAFAGLIIPFGSIVGPLVMWLIKKDESAYINYHGREALNFNITMALLGLLCFLLMFVVIGVFLLPLLAVVWLIMIIVACIKANDGVEYRYPFALRLIS
ncbi:DUF4870 domain-containing protein [Pleionea litopenaei]|uniref:DUF4870 domain-containing protein n=1 Tax=Pleionea litopenaei TaxID=3070815 RepID=A0AA51X5G6_9GAMM|nr:DUF4870 domain-containing protein [Pleionea sp. HL-JVS1]WMS85571.1 DUF4870 domain-containing protein [Pleionea sp. HL-JVS1]